ncbi:hypothetical protein ABPG74_000234 [Tetrahymena malaccensis]
MLQDLLAELKKEVAESKQEMKQLKSTVSSMKKVYQSEDKSIKFKDQSINDKMVAKSQPKFGFSKAERFKKDGKNNVGSSAAPPDILSAAAEITSTLPHQKKAQNIVFPLSKRFQDQKKDDFRDIFYDVKFDQVKPKSQGIVINPPASKNKHSSSQYMNASTVSQDSRFSDLETQASLSQFIGPGAYTPNYSCVEPKKGVPIPKSKRFEQPKKASIDFLNPNYDAIKRKAPGVSIKDKIPRNAKQEAKDNERRALELEAAMLQRMEKLEKDKYLRANPGGVVIKKSVRDVTAAPKGSRQKIAAVFKLLDQLREIRERGPAAYEIQKPEPAPTMVVYRKSSYSPLRKDPKEDIPGPDYYYCKDDMIKEAKPAWTFAKELKEKPISLEDQDNRNYEINENQTKKNPISAIIQKEHKPKFIGEEGQLELERGPGAYYPQYNQTEKRTDIGVVKIPQINENNARENNMDYLYQNENFDNDLIFPSVDPIKPNNKKGFKYYEPIDHKPDNPPDKELFKEEWQFYDYDLNKIRENMTKGGDFSNKMQKDIFAEHEEFMRIMREYYDKQNKIPHLGEYEVDYRQVDRHIPGIDIDKMPDKDTGPIVKPEGDVDGDNLILNNVERPTKKLPDIKFDKMVGRPEKDEDNVHYEEEIKLDVNIAPIKPKVPVLVNMKKQKERDEIFGAEKQEEEKVDLDIKYTQQDKKIKGYVDIGKIQTREEDPNYNPKVKDAEVYIEPEVTQTKPQKKAGVNMGKGAKRFPTSKNQ